VNAYLEALEAAHRTGSLVNSPKNNSEEQLELIA
jgi:hypothetical protein